MNEYDKSFLVRKILELGYEVDPEVIEYLCFGRTLQEALHLVNQILKYKQTIDPFNKYISGSDFVSLNFKNEQQYVTDKEVKDRYEILFDSSSSIIVPNEPGSYLDYLKSRFEAVNAILKERLDWKEVTPIGSINHIAKRSRLKIKVCGLVYDKVLDKKTSYLTIEDGTGSIKLSVSATFFNKVKEFLLDEFIIVTLDIKEGQFDVISVNHLDTAPVNGKRADEDVYAVFLSDLRVGNKNFDRESWDNFSLWINKKIGESNIVSRVKYVVIVGDLIDNTDISNYRITDQYRLLYELIQQIPKDIKVFLIPGERDATRYALPQPAIPRIFAKELYNLKNVVMLGNPSYISLHGVSVLVYHGQSLDDVKRQLITVNDEIKVTDLMVSLLKARHLAPSLGMSTAIAPDRNDLLVINTVPDIFVCGHINQGGVDFYKGSLLLNCCSWIRNQKHVKQGKVALVNLRTFDVLWRI